MDLPKIWGRTDHREGLPRTQRTSAIPVGFAVTRSKADPGCAGSSGACPRSCAPRARLPSRVCWPGHPGLATVLRWVPSIGAVPVGDVETVKQRPAAARGWRQPVRGSLPLRLAPMNEGTRRP